MSGYSTYDTESGEFTHVYELEKCLKAIRVRNRDNENRIKHLEEENKKLKENNYKDDELSKMKTQLENCKKIIGEVSLLVRMKKNPLKNGRKNMMKKFMDIQKK